MGIIDGLPAHIEKFPGGGLLMTGVNYILNEAKASSMWYMRYLTKGK